MSSTTGDGAARIRGRYEILEVVGAGGQGRVVRALDHLHNRTVALKVRPLRSEADRDALLSEAGILFRLPASPHLPVVREDFFDGDDYVIVMDWVEGTDLARILHTEGRPGLPPTLVLEWMADAATALTHLHTQDSPVIHGDIKPANLILTKGGRVSLVDFGASSATVGSGRLGGTPGYAAPERANRGELTRASDIYSLAATAFALLTGAPPTGVRPTWEGIDRDLGRQLEAAIREGLATDPVKRPSTPGAFVERLRAGWASSLPTGVLTFCFTDIVGSTAYWEKSPAAMSHALVLHDNTIATAVERRGGRLIDAMGEGDSTVSIFGSPVDAVLAAADVVRDLDASPWPGEVNIGVRVALHTGESEFRDGTYYGATPSIGARVRALADRGEVLVSADTAALTRDHLPEGWSLIDLGPVTLRGRSERMDIFALAAPGVVTPTAGTECPYPGLLAFGTGDAERYFGRDAVIDDLLERLCATPFVAVIGASGSGKSSLLQAGVGSRWRAGADVCTPGLAPVSMEHLLEPSDRLLIVDQFEELFTAVGTPDAREAFVDSLMSLQRPVAIGLRADFYGQCASYRELAASMASHQVLLGPMSAAELRAAIEEPARRAALRLETGLVDVLVNEVGGEAGQLPLLAHALRATWEARDGRTLTLAAYRSTGGVKGAIATTADQVMASFDDEERALARQLLLRLVEPGDGTDDTRRRATLAELRPAGDTTGRADHIIDTLVSARLVSVGAGTVQVNHEALIREWPQLRGWIADERADLRLQRQVTAAATAWDGSGREPTELYRGPRLAAATEWLDRQPHASQLEIEFVRESEAESARVQRAQVRANRRLRGALVGVGVALVVALVGTIVAVSQGRQASDSRDQAEVARLAALSRSLVERQPDVGLLLAVEAYRRKDTDDTRSTLLSAIETHPLLLGLIQGGQSGFGSAVFTPDGGTLATTTSDGSGIVLWDAATRSRVGALRDGRRVVIDAGISPDGTTLAATTVMEGPDGLPVSHVQVWDLANRTLIREVESPAGLLSSLAFSSDGATVITQAGVYFDRPPDLIAVVWDTASWQPRGEPWVLASEYPDDSVTFVSGDGRVLAIPDGDGVTVFDVATRERRSHITIAEGQVTTLALGSDGSTLAVGLDTGGVLGLDSTTGEHRFEASTGADVLVTTLELSRDDTVLAAGTVLGRTQLIDAESGAALGPPLAASSAAIHDVSFNADGTQLATTGGDRTGAIWRLDGVRPIAHTWHDHERVTTRLDATSDGRMLVSGGGDGLVVVRDLQAETTTSSSRAGEVLSVDIDASDTRVVSADTGGEVVVASLPDLRPAASVGFPGAVVHDATFNPRTGVIAFAVENHPGEEIAEDAGFLGLWDPASGEEVAPRVNIFGGNPIALAWTPDGETLVVSYDNNVVRIFRSTGSQLEQVGDDLVSEDDTVQAVAVAPDGTTFAVGTASGIVRRYELATREQVGPDMRGHTFEVTGVAYSRDGAVLASTTVGLSTTRLWDADTGLPIGGELTAGATPFTVRTLPIDHSYPSTPVFDPTGETLFTAAVDGTVMAWDLRPRTWVDAACGIVGRDLSEDEWRQYLGGAAYRETCTTLSG